MDRENIYQGIERCSRYRDIRLDKLMLVALQRIDSLRNEAAKGG
jgi:hypothetical protein